jgi:NTE family protein
MCYSTHIMRTTAIQVTLLIGIFLSFFSTLLYATTPQVALVLGSGGARGYAHLGVLQALEDAHIPVDLVVGASAGSIFAAFYADNASFQKTHDIMMRATFWDFADIGNIPFCSIISGKNLTKFLAQNMHAQTFSQLKKKLVLATTDFSTGKTISITNGAIAPAVLASSALPGLVMPVSIEGHTLFDGGVSDPVPVDLAKKYQPKIIIAVVVAEDLPLCTTDSSVKIFKHAYDIMWQRLTEFSARDADIIIHPKIGSVGTFDLDKKQQMYEAGYEATKAVIPKIRALL